MEKEKEKYDFNPGNNNDGNNCTVIDFLWVSFSLDYVFLLFWQGSFGENYQKYRSDLSFVYKIHLTSASQIHKLELLPVTITRGSVCR